METNKRSPTDLHFVHKTQKDWYVPDHMKRLKVDFDLLNSAYSPHTQSTCAVTCTINISTN